MTERQMTQETKDLMNAAHDARAKLRVGAISYEEARAIAQRYIDHANEGGKRIAKEYGGKFRPMSVTAFLR